MVDAPTHRGLVGVDAGLTLLEVQQRLGHRSPTLTAESYTHLMRERYEEGREKLEQYMQANRFRDTRTWRDQPSTSQT